MRKLAALGLILLPAVTLAQVVEPGDKSYGEEEQIGQRTRWFYQTQGRGLELQAAEKRAAAVSAMAEQTRVPMRGAGSIWQRLGPQTQTMFTWTMGNVTGRTQALAVHPTDENTLYLGTASGGVWKTTDGGTQWTAIFDQIGTQTIGSLHLEPANPNRLWVGTGEKSSNCGGYFGLGLFLSTDAGATFVSRNGSGANTLDLSWVTAVVTKPGAPSVVFAGGTGVCSSNGTASPGGLFRSLDGGATWNRLLTGSLFDIVFDPTNADTLYAGFGGAMGVQKSTDGGNTWQLLSNGISYGTSRLRVALAPSNPQIVYVLQGAPLYRSSDGGNSFSLVNSGACEGQCSYNLTIDVHPTNPDELLIGTIRHSRSTNGGATLTALTASWGGSQSVHQDTHIVRYSRSNPQRFWVGTDGGLWRTDNGGGLAGSYTNLNASIDTVQFYDVAIDPLQPDRVFGGAQDNSSSGRFGLNLWNVTRVTGDGMMNLVAPQNPQIVVQAGYPSGGLPQVHRSTSGGGPGTLVTIPSSGLTSGEPYPWVTPLAVSPPHHVHPATIFLGSNRLYRGPIETTSGFSWTALSAASLGSTLSVIEPFIQNGVLGVFAGSQSGRIYRCDNVGTSSSCSEITGSVPATRFVTDIAVDRLNPRRVFLTRAAFDDSRLYVSNDLGATWTAIGNALPGVPANAVAIDPMDRNTIYVGTDIGMYRSVDAGLNFVPFNDGMPLGNVITDLEISAPRHQLVAGSYGRGAWRIELSDVLLVSDME